MTKTYVLTKDLTLVCIYMYIYVHVYYIIYCPNKSTLQVYSYFIARHLGRFLRCNVVFRNVPFFFMQNKDDCAVEVLVRTFFVIMIRQAAKWNENMMVEKSRLPNKL